MGVNRVTITFVWNFHEKAHSGRTTLMLNEKKRTQSNKDMTLSGQSTWISCEKRSAKNRQGTEKKELAAQEVKAAADLPWQRTFFGENWTKLQNTWLKNESVRAKWPGSQEHLLDCVNCGLETDDIRTARMKHTVATTASNAVVWVESGHLKQALFSL